MHSSDLEAYLMEKMMKRASLLLVGLALALSACGTGDEDFLGDHNSQASISALTATTITLLSGSMVHFPAATFDVNTIVMFADIFTVSDGVSAYYPTTTQASEDLLGGLVVNTPADAILGADINVLFTLREGAVATAGQQYAVYRFDFDDLRWNRWADTIATIDAGALTASAVLPTNGLRGFIGSVAIFAGHTADVLPAVVPTTITGTVYDSGGNPLATDVGVYFLVGTKKVEVPVTNGRVPTGGTLANTVDSAADGTFTIQIPENLIGALVALEFGREDAALRVQEEFDVLAPATPRTAVSGMVLRYGENNVDSQRVLPGTDV
jgi:hypothetical protein